MILAIFLNELRLEYSNRILETWSSVRALALNLINGDNGTVVIIDRDEIVPIVSTIVNCDVENTSGMVYGSDVK